jgi:hypothetical protein
MHNSFDKIDHDQQMLVIMAWVVAVAVAPRLGDPDSPQHRWPVQACRLAFGLMLLTAAYAKIDAGGSDWVFSENLRNILVMENLFLRTTPMPDLALWISSDPVLWQATAAATVLGEAALVAAVFTRRPWLRVTTVVAGVGTVVGITMLMGLIGFPIVALAAVFAEPRSLVRTYGTARSFWPRAATVVLGLSVLAVVAVIDRGDALAALPLVVAGFVAVLGPVAVRHSSRLAFR